MTGSKGRVVWTLLLGLASCTLVNAAAAPPGPEERGREIYFRGTANGKEIVAFLDRGQTRVSASVFPCANCHGADGRGRNEAGVAAPDITWAVLTKPYLLQRPDGRSRPPYSERSLKRAIVLGMDSGGHSFQSIMPRFQLSYPDADDLIAFLKQLGQAPDPGVLDSQIRIGVLLPQPARLPALHAAIRKSLTDHLAGINHAGGIYGRRIELVFHDMPAPSADAAANLRAWLKDESIFALTGSFLARDESSLAPVLQEAVTPLICAFVLDPDVGSPLNRYVFYLDAGLRGEIQELLATAQKQFPAGGQAAVAAPNYDIMRNLGQYIKTTLDGTRWQVSAISPDVDGCRSLASGPRPQLVFWLSPQFSATTLRECSDVTAPQTRFLLPGSFASAELLNLPDSMDHRVFVTRPRARASASPAVGQVSATDTEAANWFNSDSMEAPAVASARLLVWALQRAGRNLTRQRLMEVLEEADNLDLGSGFSVTYGPNRRVGGSGHQTYEVNLRSHKLEPVNKDSP